MKVIGIDSGLTGAICLFDPSTQNIVVYDFPTIQVKVGKVNRTKIQPVLLSDVISVIRVDNPDQLTGYIEGNNARPPTGRAMGATSVWSMAQAQAYAEMALECHKIPFQLIPPSKWKKILGVPKDKEAARQFALRLFPNQSELFARKKDHNRAEAALLAMTGAQLMKE